MKDIIVFDLDGTLRDGTHRSHLVPKEKLDRTESWDAFNRACGKDAPILDNLALMRCLYQNYFIVILTSCSDVAQTISRRWLQEHGGYYSQLIMRPEDDHRPDTEFKEAMLRKIGLDRILCCYEDNFRVAKHIRSLGLTCHVVRHYDNPGDHEK